VRVLLDTNVVLDVLLEWPEWVTDAAIIWEAAEDGRLECFLTATSLTTIYYVTHRSRSADEARRAVRNCLDHLTMIGVDEPMLERAYFLAGRDFEDDLQVACAAGHLVDAIVTRDLDFP